MMLHLCGSFFADDKGAEIAELGVVLALVIAISIAIMTSVGISLEYDYLISIARSLWSW